PVKAALRRVENRHPGACIFPEVLEPTRFASFAHAPEDVPWAHVDVGPVDVVSAGAITNALLHGLLRMPRTRAEIRVIDDDRAEISNLNRYALLRRSDLNRLKVAILQAHTVNDVRIEAVNARLLVDVASPVGQLAPQVVVGADAVSVRWAAQRRDPDWLAVGATADFLTLTSEHLRGSPCAGCLHPRDDGAGGPIPTISFVSYWAGLLTLTRLLRRAGGFDNPASRRALVLVPLRLDLPTSTLWHGVQYSPACPVATHR
ncbi:MAG: ThiF family adenylyltransferase, partial [Candidatus Dormibacteria bacterium]